MIEKIIHIFERGHYREEHVEIIRKNRLLLSNYEFKLWSNEMIEEFMKEHNTDDDKIKLKIVCKEGGFYVDMNYVFFKNIDVFLNYDFLGVYNKNELKFFGSKKNNSTNLKNIKIINPIYLYPELGNSHYRVVVNNKEYMFGANILDSPWVFDRKLTGIGSEFNYKTDKYFLKSNDILLKNTRVNEILIVVAHPDDEILWFGDLILNNSNKIKVLCVTNYSNERRRNEFKKIMEKCKVDYEMWDFSDLRSYADCPLLKEKLSKIIPYHKYIYTHSLSGESGHPTHILIYKCLYDLVKNNLYVSNLYYNGVKYSEKKKELLEMYHSQRGTFKHYIRMTKKEDYLKIN